ncbi:MAG: hypothetical protein RL112_2936 [Planctomycetota bacterium]
MSAPRPRCGGGLPRALPLLLLALSSCFDNAPTPAEDPLRPGDASARAVAAPGPDAQARLREALELDLAPEVAAEARGALLAPESSVELRAMAALVLAQVGESRAALDACRGDAPATRLARARILLEQFDDPAGAAACLLDADGRARDADSGAAWLLAGRARARAQDCAGATPLLVEGLRLAPHEPDSAPSRALLFSCALQRGARDEAPALERAARASAQWQATLKARRLQARARPREPLPRIGIAELWLSVDEPRRALAALDEWSGDPLGRDAARLVSLRGECLRRAGEREAARAELARARALAPDDAELAAFEALLARDEGDRPRALDLMRRACDMTAAREGRLLRAQLELARWLLEDGRADEARERHARYLELGGDEPLERR